MVLNRSHAITGLMLFGVSACAPGAKILTKLPTLSTLLPSSVPLTAVAGREWTAPVVQIIDENLEVRTDIEDTVTAKMYTDSTCTTEAEGTVVSPEIALSNGVATVTGIKFTPTTVAEASYYAGFTSKEYVYTGCALISTKIIYPFAADTGYTTYTSSGTGFTGATRTELPMTAAPIIDADGKITVALQSTNDSGGKGLTVLRYLTDGSLDSTFGTAGVFQYQPTGTGAAGAALGAKVDTPVGIFAATSGGYYVVGSSKTAAAAIHVVVWKLTAAGALDTSFDTDGVYEWGTGVTSVNAATIDADEVLYVSGQSTATQLGFWTVATATPGVTDHSVTLESGAIGNSIRLTGTGTSLRVWIAGQVTATAGGIGGFVAKFKDDFTADTWGPQSTGVALLDIGQDPADGVQGVAGGVKDIATALLVLSNDKILVTGTTHNGAAAAPSGTAMVTWKLLSTGSFDTAYGTSGRSIFQDGDNGAARATNAAKEDDAKALYVDSAGITWIFGSSKNGSGGVTPVMWRMDSSGSMDPTWGTASTVGYSLYKAGVAGHAGATNAAKNDSFYGFALDSWSRIVVLGRANTAAGSSLLWIGRLTAAGAWDL